MAFYEFVFSPTGGTKKAAGILAGELAKGLTDGSPVHSLSIIDLTDGRADFAGIRLAPNDTVLIAVPSYGGRVPLPAGERLAQIKGNGAKAVLVCVYGNRAYEDTLAELQDIAEAAGFAPAAPLFTGQSSLQALWRYQACAGSCKELHAVRPVRCPLSGTGHRQLRCPKNRRRKVYFLYAVRRPLPPKGPTGRPPGSVCRG